MGKGKSIVKIVILSLVVVILSSILICGIAYGSSFSIPFISFGGDYEDAEKYIAGNAEIDNDKINKIEIDWVAGDVKVEPWSGTTIKISESSGSEISERNQMHYYVSDNTLKIQYKGNGFWFGTSHKKNLTVLIPENQNISSYDFECVSANITAEKLKGCNVSVDTVSGKTRLNGELENVDIETVSGKVEINTTVVPHSFDCDSVSGDARIYMPDTEGFTLRFESVSGDFSSDMQTAKNNKSYIHGNGEREFDFESVSGDCDIYVIK